MSYLCVNVSVFIDTVGVSLSTLIFLSAVSSLLLILSSWIFISDIAFFISGCFIFLVSSISHFSMSVLSFKSYHIFVITVVVFFSWFLNFCHSTPLTPPLWLILFCLRVICSCFFACLVNPYWIFNLVMSGICYIPLNNVYLFGHWSFWESVSLLQVLFLYFIKKIQRSLHSSDRSSLLQNVIYLEALGNAKEILEALPIPTVQSKNNFPTCVSF